MAAGSVINFQWYFWGYSLTFSPTGKSGFIGDLKHFGLKHVLGNPSPGSPLVSSLLYSFYQVFMMNFPIFSTEIRLTSLADAILRRDCGYRCWSRR